MAYCIDTSFFIEGWRRYPQDVFPTLWEKIKEQIENHILISVDEVLNEIKRKDDALHEWLKPHVGMFNPLDHDTMLNMRKILNQYPEIVKEGKTRNSADVVVIAYAMSYSHTVVTEEKNNKSNGIPAVCKNYSVIYVDSVRLFRDLYFKF